MSGDQYSTRLTDKDRRKIERYRDENNVSKAEALRHGVRELERDRSATSDEASDENISDWLVTLVRNWGIVLGSSISVLVLSNAGVLPDFLELVTGIVLLPALAYSWVVSRL